ncbi:antibiotic biosynthesis monooxygenase family protein [Kribbella sindirgiensis]|uniref:Antibiotic biosynthesis monooxygenase n=1 Tax=Kribbella sindirgiensis TaxID=1124744 RepID=A0A4R0IFV8_9ACTN|nr:hypothetical protein [Kribbella sindirgiensis]TCC32171.1 hypothetical protein E0H50_18270 [Kribbella sindirgiensis]
MIRSVLSLRAADISALEDLYAEHGILARARRFPGCRDASLLRSVDGGPATHLVIADWDTAADYQHWVEDPWRVALSGQLAAVLDTTAGEPIVGALFELVAADPSTSESPVSSAPITPEEHP